MTRSRRIVPWVLAGALAAALVLGWLLRPVSWEDTETPPPLLESARALLEAGDLERGARAMRRGLRRVRAPHWEDRYRLLAARRLADAERYEDARRILPEPLSDSSVLAGHADLVRARIALGSGRTDEALESAERAIVLPGFPEADEARRVAASALEREGRTEAALRMLDASPSWTLRLEGALLAARAGEREAARDRFVRIVLSAGDPVVAERALDALEEAIPLPGDRFSAGERTSVLETAARWIEENRAGPALRLLRAGRGPDETATEPDQALGEAHALWRMGRSAEARPLALLAREGAGAVRDGGLYVLARVDLSRGRVSSWRSTLEALARRPGASPWKLRALRDLAMAGEGSPSSSTLSRYRAYRTAAGDNVDPTAMHREFWAAWELKRWKEADAALERILSREDMPVGVRAAALYWAGRRKEAQGRRKEAREREFEELRREFPNHYYGAVLERHQGRVPPVPPTSPSANPRLAECGDAARWIEAARQLSSVGLWTDAAESYRASVDAAPPGCSRPTALEAMESALGASSPSDALDFAARAVGDMDRCPTDAVPRAVWRLLLPAPSADLLERAAEKEGLDSRFLVAVVRQESGFQPMAVSSAGARGLLQVMPAVGMEWSRRLGIRGFDPDDLFDPESNLRVGTAYLRSLSDRFPFPAAALAAYNAGPARAQRWLRAGDTQEEFVERIPIPETRLYVKRILTLERLYRVAWPEGLRDPSPDAGPPRRW